MMTFLYPLMLGLGVLIAVPFIIHLMGERKYRPVAFSSLKFLREIERESLQRLHLRQWLILASRAMWIAMLVLALAMPFLNTTNGKMQRGILVIDRSFSTRIDPGFIDIEKEIIKNYARWQHVSYDETSNIDSARAQLETLIQESGQTATNILVLSDCQKNRQNQQIAKMLYNLSHRTYYLPKIKSGLNYSIIELEKEDRYDRDIKGIRVLGSSNSEDSRETTIHIYVNGKQAGQMLTDKSGHADYFFSIPEENESLCRVKSLDDDYPEDNSRYLVINNYNKIRILCINDPKDGYYHVKALKAMDNIELKEILPGELSTQDLKNYDLLWFSGLYTVNTAGVERIKKYSVNAPCLITTDRTISSDDPWLKLIKGIDTPVRSSGYLGIRGVDGREMDDMKIRTYYRSLDNSGKVLWETDDGSPLLFESDKNVFQLMTPFHFDMNEMGLSPYFTRELNRVMNTMLERQIRSYTCGDAISMPGSFSMVTTPTGEKHRVKGHFDKTSIPGFYRIENDGNTWTIAVNIPAEECIQDTMKKNNIQVIEWDGNYTADIHKQIKGRNIQTLFFVLAAMFIMLEMLLLRTGEKTK